MKFVPFIMFIVGCCLLVLVGTGNVSMVYEVRLMVIGSFVTVLGLCAIAWQLFE